MEQKTSRKKYRLLLFIGIPILILFALAVFAVSGLNTFLKPVIKRSLSKVIVNGSDSLYTFSLKDYTIGPGGRSAVITGLDIQVDSGRYKLLKAAGLLPPMIVSIQVEKASVTGISPWELWRNKNIIASGIVLNGAKVNLQQQQKSTDTIAKGPQKTLYELIKPDINIIDIRRISIQNADILFKTVQKDTLKREAWRFKNAGVIIDDILVDSMSHLDTSKIWYASNLQLALGSFNMNATDGIYKFSAKNTDYNFKDRSVTIEDLKILPAISKAAFNKRMGHEADLFTVIIPKINIENFNSSALLIDNFIEAEKIRLTEPDIDIYKDRTAGIDNRSKMGKYPHQLLMKADIAIRVKKLAITKGKLLVTQKSLKTGENGSFKFNNVNGDIVNITNQKADIATNHWLKADLSAAFMGPNTMNAVFNFDLASGNGHFITDATLESLQPSQINPAFRALAEAELGSFKLNQLKYHVEGFDGYAVGDLTLRYQDLKLNVLKKEDDGDLKKNGIISLLANMLKIYDHNPMPGEAERKAINIRDERLPNKNFFGLVVRTMLKCTQEIALKGKNKTLPGMTAKTPAKSDKKEDKKDRKRREKKKD
ncbi:MAG: hypothetical protein V4717_10965 [Bacteroidota bacterium]